MKTLHTILKTIFILTNAAILPISVFAITHSAATTLGGGLPLFLGLYLLSPFWVILFVGLNTYYFPLNLGSAARVIFFTYLQFFVFLFVTHTDWTYAVYSLFYASFITIMIFWIVLFCMAMFNIDKFGLKKTPWWVYLLVLIFVGATGTFTYVLSGPFLERFALIPTAWMKAVAMATFALQLIFQLVGPYRSFHAKNIGSDIQKQMDAEWNRWITVVVLAMILSSFTALFSGGLFSSHS